MNDFVENFKTNLQEIWKRVSTKYAKLVGRPVKDGSVVSADTDSNYEINLVPAVKAQMIKAQKMRNLVLFICIVVSAVAVGVVFVLFGLKSGQDIMMASQDRKLEKLSGVLNSYDELDDLVTIQGQLAKYAELAERKTVLSRVFGALGVMLPQGNDVVKMSELRVDLTSDAVSLEGQANARVAPLIDYRVLESFKKSVDLTKYDYGRYVDIDGKALPTQCIKEADEEGNALRSGESYYAWWDLSIAGCEGAPRSLELESAEMEYHYSKDAEVEYAEAGEGEEETKKEVARVKIWRTPQFENWYQAGEMSMDGRIVGREHFESECYVYKGTETVVGVRWTSTNDCLLAPKGLTVVSSANGRDDSDNLVLRFTASVSFAEEFFSFQNKHMIAIGPMGQNVTDSFVQIGNMFTQEATACDADDVECLTTGGGR